MVVAHSDVRKRQHSNFIQYGGSPSRTLAANWRLIEDEGKFSAESMDRLEGVPPDSHRPKPPEAGETDTDAELPASVKAKRDVPSTAPYERVRSNSIAAGLIQRNPLKAEVNLEHLMTPRPAIVG
jgi:hypothetical protein